LGSGILRLALTNCAPPIAQWSGLAHRAVQICVADFGGCEELAGRDIFDGAGKEHRAFVGAGKCFTSERIKIIAG